MKLPSDIHLRAAGLPHVLRTVEDALKMIAKCQPEIAQLPRWTFAKGLLQAALASGKSRDLNAAARQLKQAIDNEKWA